MRGLGTVSAGGWLPPILGNSPAVPLQGQLENRGTDASVLLENVCGTRLLVGPPWSVCVWVRVCVCVRERERERESQEEWREREGRG